MPTYVLGLIVILLGACDDGDGGGAGAADGPLAGQSSQGDQSAAGGQGGADLHSSDHLVFETNQPIRSIALYAGEAYCLQDTKSDPPRVRLIAVDLQTRAQRTVLERDGATVQAFVDPQGIVLVNAFKGIEIPGRAVIANAGPHVAVTLTHVFAANNGQDDQNHDFSELIAIDRRTGEVVAETRLDDNINSLSASDELVAWTTGLPHQQAFVAPKTRLHQHQKLSVTEAREIWVSGSNVYVRHGPHLSWLKEGKVIGTRGDYVRGVLGPEPLVLWLGPSSAEEKEPFGDMIARLGDDPAWIAATPAYQVALTRPIPGIGQIVRADDHVLFLEGRDRRWRIEWWPIKASESAWAEISAKLQSLTPPASFGTPYTRPVVNHLNRVIGELELDPYIQAALMEAGISTIGQLIASRQTTIAGLKGIDKAALGQIEEHLADLGLFLKREHRKSEVTAGEEKLE